VTDKTLIISDLHLGSPLFNQKLRSGVLDLLYSQCYKTIVINGDLFDTWERPIEETAEIESNIIEAINIRASTVQVVIIKGNHDPDISTLQELFPKCCISNSYEFDLDKSGIIVHGDEYDSYIDNYLWLAKLVFPIQWVCERLFKINLKAIIRNTTHWLTAKFKKQEYNTLILGMEKEPVENLVGDYFYIIVGHTHLLY